ncbi:MAG: nuclease, partial [Lachnospiraceae bacterium]|nr:nuclease [Lachnospiraceae bacterium]
MEDEKNHQEDLRRIREFRLIDDDFMNACLDGDVVATQLILRIFLGRPDITVRRVTPQKVMKNLLGRDVWLDVD